MCKTQEQRGVANGISVTLMSLCKCVAPAGGGVLWVLFFFGYWQLNGFFPFPNCWTYFLAPLQVFLGSETHDWAVIIRYIKTTHAYMSIYDVWFPGRGERKRTHTRPFDPTSQRNRCVKQDARYLWKEQVVHKNSSLKSNLLLKPLGLQRLGRVCVVGESNVRHIYSTCKC
jgi:hypothetical protein